MSKWVSLEANIAGGKTTLQRALIPRLQQYFGAVVQVNEPVDEWVERGVLQRAYDNPREWNFPVKKLTQSCLF